jgi:hypothetical protein
MGFDRYRKIELALADEMPHPPPKGWGILKRRRPEKVGHQALLRYDLLRHTHKPK